MNGQIRELAHNAGLYVDLGHTVYPRAMSAEECEAAYAKFAELIVKECMKVAAFKDADTNVVGYMAIYRLQGRSTAAQMIKEHFGVE